MPFFCCAAARLSRRKCETCLFSSMWTLFVRILLPPFLLSSFSVPPHLPVSVLRSVTHPSLRVSGKKRKLSVFVFLVVGRKMNGHCNPKSLSSQDQSSVGAFFVSPRKKRSSSRSEFFCFLFRRRFDPINYCAHFQPFSLRFCIFFRDYYYYLYVESIEMFCVSVYSTIECIERFYNSFFKGK